MKTLSLFRPNGAVFDHTSKYRYTLWRNFVEHPTSICLWVMLNPSTATEEVDDPTIRRCQRFSRAWGHDACRVVNIFAYRSTDPAVLSTLDDPVGPHNDLWIATEAMTASRVVCAWGIHGALNERSRHVRAILRARDVKCESLGFTKSGEPLHPLYRPNDSTLVPFA